MLRTKYQLRFSCGTRSRGVFTVIRQRNSNVSHEILSH